jgi:hypothetical protein
VVEEDAVVADEVDDRELVLALRNPETAAELLEEHHRRLRRPQHHDAVDERHVDALVEEVDGADRVELTRRELAQRLLAIRRSGL